MQESVMTVKDIVFVVGFLITVCKIVYDAGYLNAVIKQNVNNIRSLKESIKRLHGRLDGMKCVTRPECNEQASRFETRLESYQAKLCELIEDLKKNQGEMSKILAVLVDKTKDK